MLIYFLGERMKQEAYNRIMTGILYGYTYQQRVLGYDSTQDLNIDFLDFC